MQSGCYPIRLLPNQVATQSGCYPIRLLPNQVATQKLPRENLVQNWLLYIQWPVISIDHPISAMHTFSTTWRWMTSII